MPPAAWSRPERRAAWRSARLEPPEALRRPKIRPPPWAAGATRPKLRPLGAAQSPTRGVHDGFLEPDAYQPKG
ncbi:hypothetical protein ACP70R_005905 [Stipagrostis hirtigluma subsp. patula]